MFLDNDPPKLILPPVEAPRRLVRLRITFVLQLALIVSVCVVFAKPPGHVWDGIDCVVKAMSFSNDAPR